MIHPSAYITALGVLSVFAATVAADPPPCLVDPLPLPQGPGPIWVQLGDSAYWHPNAFGVPSGNYPASQDIHIRLSQIPFVAYDGVHVVRISDSAAWSGSGFCDTLPWYVYNRANITNSIGDIVIEVDGCVALT